MGKCFKINIMCIIYLSAILEGQNSWMNNTTIQKAINVDEGVIVKESVLTFQNRMVGYPHDFIGG